MVEIEPRLLPGALSPPSSYVDPEQNPDSDPLLVGHCPTGEQQQIRFVDPDQATPGQRRPRVLALPGLAVSSSLKASRG
jgi:hypothetical protein